MLVSFGAATAATGAAQARDLEEDDDATASKGRGQLSDAELMYRAMKRSNRDSKDDVAIDRAIARARVDSEHRKRALRESMSTWRDPFADPADRTDRGNAASANASPRQRQLMRRSDEELRAARSEAARARWEAAAARAEAASARAEAADAKVDAARAEAAAARAQFVASKQTCGVLDPPPKPRRPTVAVREPREPRDDRRSTPAASSGDWMPAMRRASAHSTAPRRLPTSATSRPAPAAPVPAAAPVVAAPRPAEPPAPPPAPARPAAAPTGIIVVPIPPPPEPERPRRRN
jgi:hypothetical protein